MRNDAPYIYVQTFGWTENPRVRTVTTTTSDWYDRHVNFKPYRAVWYDARHNDTLAEYIFKDGMFHLRDKEIQTMPNVDDLL